MNIIKLWALFLGVFGWISGGLGVKFKIYSLVYLLEWSVLSINSMNIEMIFLVDWLMLIFLSVVLIITSMVLLYSIFYLEGEVYLPRFIMLVIMFVLSMVLMIISPNLLSILLGWDGLGLISYCLVIYYQNVKSVNAGALTVFMNRIGDVSLILSGVWVMNYGSWNFFFVDYWGGNGNLYFLSGMILLSAMTKSAQFPFSSWLPAAMAAPTPVSSLVHSSTLVTAGVYLLIRFSNLIYYGGGLKVLILVSSVTMFMAGLGANFEFDLKKVIALSTLSQLGLMISIFCLGFVDLTFFHLITHAMFKAMLFMSAGILIHNLGGQQDIRFMGSLFSQMPLLSVCFNVANLSLCGFPFLSGFYSKDVILEMVMISYYNLLIYILFFFSMLFTIMYTFRVTYYSMLGGANLLVMSSSNMKSNLFMMKSMLMLLIFVIFGGGGVSWSVFSYPYLICLPFWFKMVPLSLIMIGVILSYLMFILSINKMFKFKMNYLIYFVGMMWFMPILSGVSSIKGGMFLGKSLVNNIDQGWVEYFSKKMIYESLINGSKFNNWVQYNFFSVYLFIFYIFSILLIFFSLI
uniref:NADH-ubiquinone oxidoreductase chain 5 n=1 Tax=Runaria punctata TaxID=2950364 RepID=A0A977XSV6_9HYME|nr:NADH dehydrogenase subunit 5 [Runaria punctata]UXW93354.1 NADH dehydrogenase subunit 5 [Runaria punctata]